MVLSPSQCLKQLTAVNFNQTYGKVTRVIGLVAEGTGLNAPLGSVCHILPEDGTEPIAAEVA